MLVFVLVFGNLFPGALVMASYEEAYEADPDGGADIYAWDDAEGWTDDADWSGTDLVIEAEEGSEEGAYYTEEGFIEAAEDSGSYEESAGGRYSRDSYEDNAEVEEGEEVVEGEEGEEPRTHERLRDGVETDEEDSLPTGDSEDEAAEEEAAADASLEYSGDVPSGSIVYEDVLASVEVAVEEILRKEAVREQAARVQAPGSKSAGKKARKIFNSNEGAAEALSMDPSLFAEDGFELAGASLADEKLDFRDLGYVGTAKDQSITNSCWAYATTAALEVEACSLFGRTAAEVDDSETYLALYTHMLRHGEGPVEYMTGDDTVLSKTEDPFLTGGLSNETAAFLASSLGPAREDALPPMPVTREQIDAMAGTAESYDWQDSSLLADHVVTNVAFLPEVNLWDENGVWTGRDENGITAIKKALSAGRPVVIEVYAPLPSSPYMNPERNALCVTNKKAGSSHEVVIIGWDDTFSRNNFRSSACPDHDGAWICRNSWGGYDTLSEAAKGELLTEAYNNLENLWAAYAADGQSSAGDEALTQEQKAERIARWLYSRSKEDSVDADGCFYLSYEDCTYNLPTAYELASRGEVSGLTLYQYDYLGMANCTGTKESESSGTVANVFTMKNLCDLKKVSVVTAESATEVTIDIYLLRKAAVTPVDGKKIYSKTQTLQWAGYHLLDIDQSLTLDVGSRVCVVVRSMGRDGHPYTAFEYGGKNPVFREYAYYVADNEPGTSFILTGSKWTDLRDYKMDEESIFLKEPKAGNALIKLFTGGASGAPIAEPAGTSSDTPSSSDPSGEIPSSAGTSFAPLCFKGSSSAKTRIKLSWKKQAEADGYTIYGAKKGKSMKKLKDLSGKKTSFTSKGLKKNTYYKYYIESYKMYGPVRVVTAKSPVIYVATKGGTYTNYKSVKLKSKKSLRLKVKGTSAIKASGVKADSSAKVKKCVSLRYESDNPAVAKVSKSGKITAKKKGTAAIRVYAQNGVYKTVKVTVRS